jgi:4a-hydroxytetrahydrobiopterin dehydratase
MSDSSTQEKLLEKHCTPCEGGTPALVRDEAERLARSLPGWALSGDAKQISRSWTVKNFMAGIEFFNKVAALAEDEGHHPDLHLEGYRNLSIAISTHAAGGLTENDFILAAKIDQIPVKLKS